MKFGAWTNRLKAEAFGPKQCANSDSVEYLEARAEWKHRQEKKRKYELERQEPCSRFAPLETFRGLRFSIGRLVLKPGEP
jgi:hypothetical protein